MRRFLAALAVVSACLAAPVATAIAGCTENENMLVIAGKLRDAGTGHAMMTGDGFKFFMAVLTKVSGVEPPEADGALVINKDDKALVILFKDKCYVAHASLPSSVIGLIMKSV